MHRSKTILASVCHLRMQHNKLHYYIRQSSCKSSRSPAVRRIYTSMFSSQQWHGLAQTNSPPRPHKAAWHGDITDVIWPTVCNRLDTTIHYYQALSAPSIIPRTPNLHQPARFPSPNGMNSGKCICTQSAQNRMAQRYHRRNLAAGRATWQSVSASDCTLVRWTLAVAGCSGYAVYAGYAGYAGYTGYLRRLSRLRCFPRPRKTTWRGDITDVILPHGAAQT